MHVIIDLELSLLSDMHVFIERDSLHYWEICTYWAHVITEYVRHYWVRSTWLLTWMLILLSDRSCRHYWPHVLTDWYVLLLLRCTSLLMSCARHYWMIHTSLFRCASLHCEMHVITERDVHLYRGRCISLRPVIHGWFFIVVASRESSLCIYFLSLCKRTLLHSPPISSIVTFPHS